MRRILKSDKVEMSPEEILAILYPKYSELANQAVEKNKVEDAKVADIEEKKQNV